MNSRERGILVVTCFGHFLSHFNMLVFPAMVLPLTGLLKLDIGQVLELSFWMYMLFGFPSLPWGFLADRLGTKPLLMVFFTGSGLCGFAAALNIENPAMFSLSLAGIGLFSGIYHPAGLGLIARGIDRVSLGMAYNGIFGNLGLATGPLLAGLMLWLWGPAAAYWTLGAMNLLGLVLIMTFKLSEPPRQTGQEARSTSGLVSPFLILLVAMMLGGIVYRAATVTLPTFFELNTPGILAWLSEIWPKDPSANLVATVITSLIFLIGAAGQYAGGRFGDKYDLRMGYILFHSTSLPALLAIGFLQDLPLILAATVYIFFLLGMQPIENTLVARLSPPAFKSTAYGTKFALNFGVGAVAVPLVSWVQETWGIANVFMATAMMTVLLLATILLLISKTDPMR